LGGNVVVGTSYNSGNIEQALNHWIIAASAGGYHAMHTLRISFEQGHISRDSMDSTLIAYYNSCAEMRSEAREVKQEMLSFIRCWETGTLEMVIVDFPFISRNLLENKKMARPAPTT
jgi:hypothetical protein